MRWLVHDAVAAFFPPHGDLPGVEELGLSEFLEQYQRETTRFVWAGVLLGALVYALTPLLTIGWPIPAFWLPAAQRDRHADRLAGHSVYLLRQSVFLVKMVGGLCWGQHPLVRERLALPPYPADPGSWREA